MTGLLRRLGSWLRGSRCGCRFAESKAGYGSHVTIEPCREHRGDIVKTMLRRFVPDWPTPADRILEVLDRE